MQNAKQACSDGRTEHKRMRKRLRKVYACLTLCLITLTLPTHAQTFTQHVQTSNSGEGKVTIHQDASIEQLVNGAQVHTVEHVAAPQQPLRQQQQPSRQQQQHNNNTAQPFASQQSTNATSENTQEVQTEENTGTGRRHRIVGYRVQVYSGGNTREDRIKAEQAGNSLQQLYPGMYVEVHFYSPSWKCRIGSFRNYEDAKMLRDELRTSGYPTATIVKGKITVTD